MALDECVATIFHAATPTSNRTIPTVRRRGARLAGTACAALMTVFFFFTCYAFWSAENAMRYAHIMVSCIRGVVFKSVNLQKVPPFYVTQ